METQHHMVILVNQSAQLGSALTNTDLAMPSPMTIHQYYYQHQLDSAIVDASLTSDVTRGFKEYLSSQRSNSEALGVPL
jgi:protein tyrosine phosphatase